MPSACSNTLLRPRPRPPWPWRGRRLTATSAWAHSARSSPIREANEWVWTVTSNLAGPKSLQHKISSAFMHTVELSGNDWRIAPARRSRAGFRKFSKKFHASRARAARPRGFTSLPDRIQIRDVAPARTQSCDRKSKFGLRHAIKLIEAHTISHTILKIGQVNRQIYKVPHLHDAQKWSQSLPAWYVHSCSCRY